MSLKRLLTIVPASDLLSEVNKKPNPDTAFIFLICLLKMRQTFESKIDLSVTL